MTDPIADMLTRIRNAYLSRKNEVYMPYSGIKNRIAQKLHQLGYISKISTDEAADKPKRLHLILNYNENLPVATHIKRVSSPGRRIYTRGNNIPRSLSGYGSLIISTSQGILTDKEARQQKIGGEIICEIW